MDNCRRCDCSCCCCGCSHCSKKKKQKNPRCWNRTGDPVISIFISTVTCSTTELRAALHFYLIYGMNHRKNFEKEVNKFFYFSLNLILINKWIRTSKIGFCFNEKMLYLFIFINNDFSFIFYILRYSSLKNLQ